MYEKILGHLSKMPSAKNDNSEMENEAKKKETNNFSCWILKVKTLHGFDSGLQRSSTVPL